MDKAKEKPDVRRGEMSFIFAIILGLMLGNFISNEVRLEYYSDWH